MRTLCLVALASPLALLAAPPAQAVGHLADVTITDRDSGEALKPYRHRGEYWVAGRPGTRYAISIRSQTGVRLLAVTSVDGINVLTGQDAAAGQRGYVFDPGVGYDIDGWRKSHSEIAAFTFTAVPGSYAARTGRPQNIGVIGVALFRERQPDPPMVSYERAESDSRQRPAAPASAAGAQLGTGHGEREYSRVVSVPFERAQPRPDETIRIRYDSHENLVAMGVIRAPRPRHVPDPFPGNAKLGFVPDP
jgi:hypothetical protein